MSSEVVDFPLTQYNKYKVNMDNIKFWVKALCDMTYVWNIPVFAVSMTNKVDRGMGVICYVPNQYRTYNIHHILYL